MDGDAHLVQLTAGAGSRAVVTGQSATRIHPSIRSFSTQQWHVRIEAGAVLVVLPGPNIPFQGARYYQRADIDLEPGAALIWGDIWYAGRYARENASEWFQFDRLVQELTIRRDGDLIYRDRFSWKGPWDRDSAAWHFGDAAACGSLFISGRGAGLKPAIAMAEEAGLKPAPLLDHASFSTAAGDTCIRCHGPSEAVISFIVRIALGAAAALSGQPAGEAWLPGRDLAPCHWFS